MSKGIRAKCPYPAQLRISLETGEKTFSTLMDATLTLRELEIAVRVKEKEQLERETTGGCRREEHAEEMLHSHLWTGQISIIQSCESLYKLVNI